MLLLASCDDHCGGMAESGCGCDVACLVNGDCCKDFMAACPDNAATGGKYGYS